MAQSEKMTTSSSLVPSAIDGYSKSRGNASHTSGIYKPTYTWVSNTHYPENMSVQSKASVRNIILRYIARVLPTVVHVCY